MLVNSLEREIEFGDCDPAGIVYFPRYFAFFDDATIRLFGKALGLPKIAWTEKFHILGIPVVDTGAKFHKPSTYGDIVTIESQVTEFRRSSFDVRHRLRKGDRLAVEGHETRVWVEPDPANAGNIRSREIPDAVLRAFGMRRS